MSIIAWIVLGAIAGYLAGFLVKGDEGLGIIGHIVLGIVGALVGGFLAGVLFNTDPIDGALDISSIVVATIGAVITVLVVGAVTGRSRVGQRPRLIQQPGRQPGPIPAREKAHPTGWAFSPSTAIKEEAPCPRSSSRSTSTSRSASRTTSGPSSRNSRGSWRPSRRSSSSTTRPSAGPPRSPASSKTWKARITEQTPDQRIAWTSIEGAENAGVVTFHRLDDRKTRVTLQLDVEPEGPVESAGDALGFVQRRGEGRPRALQGVRREPRRRHRRVAR